MQCSPQRSQRTRRGAAERRGGACQSRMGQRPVSNAGHFQTPNKRREVTKVGQDRNVVGSLGTLTQVPIDDHVSFDGHLGLGFQSPSGRSAATSSPCPFKRAHGCLASPIAWPQPDTGHMARGRRWPAPRRRTCRMGVLDFPTAWDARRSFPLFSIWTRSHARSGFAPVVAIGPHTTASSRSTPIAP